MKNKVSVVFCFACVCAILLFMNKPLYAAINYIEFRLVLSTEESEGKEYDTIINGTEVIRVGKYYFLSDKDLDEIMILRSAATGKVMAGFRFNESGKKQFYHILKKFPESRIAIFAHKAFLTVLPAQPARVISSVVIAWPKTEKELHWIAKQINKKPETILDLYMDETSKYNEVAAQAWADVYQNVNDAIAGKGRKEG